MHTQKNIIESLQLNEAKLKAEFILRHLFLFGSYARNEQTENSDLDLLYDLAPGSHMTLGRLNRFEKLVKEITHIEKVELVNQAHTNPIVLNHAKSSIIQLF